MEYTKKELLESKRVTSQQGIVDRLVPTPKSMKRFIVPGGANMWENVERDSEESVTNMVYVWLRAARDYTGFTISLSSDLDARKTSSTKVEDLPQLAGFPIWAQPGGKKAVAEKIARVLMRTKDLAGIRVTKDSIVALTSKGFNERSEDWMPQVLFELKRARYTS